MNRRRNYLVFAILTVLISSCSLPEVKQAKFERDTDLIVEDLIEIGSFEDASIQIKARTFNGKTSHVIEISLINGVLNENRTLYEIAEEAIDIVITSISNEADFDLFEVSFEDRDSSGFVTSSKTQTIQFTKKDLDLDKTIVM